MANSMVRRENKLLSGFNRLMCRSGVGQVKAELER